METRLMCPGNRKGIQNNVWIAAFPLPCLMHNLKLQTKETSHEFLKQFAKISQKCFYAHMTWFIRWYVFLCFKVFFVHLASIYFISFVSVESWLLLQPWLWFFSSHSMSWNVLFILDVHFSVSVFEHSILWNVHGPTFIPVRVHYKPSFPHQPRFLFPEGDETKKILFGVLARNCKAHHSEDLSHGGKILTVTKHSHWSLLP